ncbi:MAG: peptidase C39 family protein [Ectothiorhodospiraceae bacterium]|nr:peptidase C39 family protein [Ectothiorhodospiraceae bacterium]MCH8504673.1 peptidase C39 family protein [Ectothiorhodospiraceae bacterium]
MIRPADLNDLPALLDLEHRCFKTDRLSRRNFRHLLTRGHAVTLLDERGGRLAGYVLVLFRRGISLARIYSIATAPEFRGQRVAAGLVAAAEQAALDESAIEMRLEVREDNAASQALFESLQYRAFGVHAGYYEDAADAVRYHRYLGPHLDPALARVPYYRQTLDFTCGPASLMMAMKALRPELALDRRLELRIWRESTTVFMTSGHGGCGPHGLALAAYHRGFGASLYLKQDGPMFLESVRSAEKREVLQLVQEDFIDEIARLGLPVTLGSVPVAELERAFRRGGIPIVLISSYRIYREKFPHWVVVTGFDERYVYVTDPYVDEEAGKTVTDCVNMPIPRVEFDRMARYGRSGQRAVVILHRRRQKRSSG